MPVRRAINTVTPTAAVNEKNRAISMSMLMSMARSMTVAKVFLVLVVYGVGLRCCAATSYVDVEIDAHITRAGADCQVDDSVAVCGEDYDFLDQFNITKFAIMSTKLDRIDKRDFAKYENLEELDVSNCNIRRIDNDSFIYNEKLINLNLASNKDLHVSETFIVSKSLEKLNLSHIDLSKLSGNGFSGLPQLKVLDLSSTNITDFSSVSQLKHLNELIISENENLDSLCNDTHLNKIIIIKTATEIFNCDNRTMESNAQQPTVTDAHIEEPKNKETKQLDVNNDENATTTEANTETSTVNGKKESTTDNMESVLEEPLKEHLQYSTHTENHREHQEHKHSESTAGSVIESSSETNKPEGIVTTSPEKHMPKETTPNQETTENATAKETTKMTASENINVVSATSESPVTDNLELMRTWSVRPTTDAEKYDIPLADSNGTTEKVFITFSDGFLTESKLRELETKHKNNTGSISFDDIESKKILLSSVNVTPENHTATNITLAVVISVTVAALVGFGYKYWKKRQSGYRNANTEDTDDGKELQNIVAHHEDPECP